MKNTIPKKALVALPDFKNNTGAFRIVTPDEAYVPAFDRSFHFGDSIYEVVRTYQGTLFGVDEHLKRLKNSSKLGRYELYPNEEMIRDMICKTTREFFRQFGKTDVYVRITVSRGYGDLNIDPRYSSEPYALVFVKELESYPEKIYSEGVEFAVVERRRNHPSATDPGMKSGNYLNNILAISEATAMGASDAIMLDLFGFVTEGTTNNIYIVRGDEVWTAPTTVGILAGITRDFVFDVCKQKNQKIQERLFTQNDLISADEIFFSSSTKEVVPVTRLNGQPVANGKPGPVTQMVARAYKDLILEKIKTGECLYS